MSDASFMIRENIIYKFHIRVFTVSDKFTYHNVTILKGGLYGFPPSNMSLTEFVKDEIKKEIDKLPKDKIYDAVGFVLCPGNFAEFIVDTNCEDIQVYKVVPQKVTGFKKFDEMSLKEAYSFETGSYTDASTDMKFIEFLPNHQIFRLDPAYRKMVVLN